MSFSFPSSLRRFGMCGLFSIACAASVEAGHAQYIWSGGGSTSNWSNSNNWSGGSAPSNGAEIHFAGTTNLSPLNDLNLTSQNANGVNGLFFDANAGAF